MDNNKQKSEASRTKLIRILKNYDKVYYISIFINFLVLSAIFFEFVFIFIIENEYKYAFISLIVSAVLALISFCIKFAFNNAVSELLMYLMEKEENTKENIALNLKQISSVLNVLLDKSGGSEEELLKLMSLFNYNKINKTQVQVEEKEKSNIEKVADDNK